MSKTRPKAGAKLDEVALRAELKSLRAQIPDHPTLNPIVNVAFDLSRRPKKHRLAMIHPRSKVSLHSGERSGFLRVSLVFF